MASTEAQKKASKKFAKKAYDTISFISRRESRVRELIGFAANKKNISKNQYIADAIYKQLKQDGITIESLPDIPTKPRTETKEPKQCMCYLITYFYAEPEEYQAAPNRFWFDEKYVTVVGTLSAAKKYISNKFSKKPYPERYHYVIYGRYIDALSKLEAVNKYKEIAYVATENYYRELDKFDEASGDVFVRIKTFIGFMNDFRKPDYVEVVEYNDDNSIGT